MAPSRKHEDRLTEAIEEMRSQGYRVIRLNGKSPDAIAMKDGKLIAVEVLPRTSRVERRQKVLDYSMFDYISFYLYEKRPTMTVPFSSAYRQLLAEATSNPR